MTTLPALALAALASSQSEVVIRDKSVTPPKLIRQIAPRYTSEAWRARVQGAVVIEIVVDSSGLPRNAAVVSPLGFGLDERALRSVARWRFRPAMKDGKPVAMRSQVQINFRLPGRYYDAKAEQRRSAYNVAVVALGRDDPKRRSEAVQAIEKLAAAKFIPAMHTYARILREGELAASDPERAKALLRAAADKYYGPAMFEVGLIQVSQAAPGAGREAALKLIRDAAVLGSVHAQFWLGVRHQTGDGIEQDPDRARRYFRLCAAQGIGLCQYRLACSMLENPSRSEHDYLQALAWHELAARQGVAESRNALESERGKLTEEQRSWVDRLKGQLLTRR